VATVKNREKYLLRHKKSDHTNKWQNIHRMASGDISSRFIHSEFFTEKYTLKISATKDCAYG
jgi:hypothetical protein